MMPNQFAGFLAATAQVPTPFFKNDLEIANYALTLEHLENAFYKQVTGSGRLSGKALTYLQVVGRHEQEHVDFLTSFIRQAGGTPVAAARGYDFAKLGDLNSQAGILKVAEMLEQTGVKDVRTYDNGYYPGMGIHEMGTARMGRDPKTSVLNSHNQVWDAPNVFVTDGACMVSTACQNPSLSYMAFSARAADFAVRELNRRNL
jgi:choline dehydrogenase-like flavoprotein